MGLADKMKDLTKKAQDAAVEHEEQVLAAIQKAEVAADQQTGGKYHDQIAKAGGQAETYVEKLATEQKDSPSADAPAPSADAPAGPAEQR